MPPKSQEFRRIERRVLGPVMRNLGFRRPAGVGLSGWVRPDQNAWLVVWTQLGKWNYGDDPEGYRFTLELQLGSEPIAGTGSRRMRYHDLLDRAQKLAYLDIYNRAMAKAKPNQELMALLNAREQARHIAELRPRREVPGPLEDPWFPYIDEDDVEAWMMFLAGALPKVLDRFLTSGVPTGSGDIPGH